MKCLALLLMTMVICQSAETFTLDDGRTLTGEYDEAEQRLYTTINGRTTSFLVAKEQIVSRGAYEKTPAPKPVATPQEDPETAAEAPKPMTAEEKAAAEAAFARVLKVREAEKLEGEARKATRQAAEARSDSARKKKEAQRHWEAFRKRAAAEGVGTSDEPVDELIVLPRTSGNNRASMEALLDSKRLLVKAAEYDALAEKKLTAAEQVRAGR